MTNINHKNADKIKHLADRLEYEVTSVKKVIRIISSDDNTFAYDMYKEDMQHRYGEQEKNIVAVENRNSRDYWNVFTGKDNTTKYIDIDRVKLSKKEKSYIDAIELGTDYEKNIDITWNTDITPKKCEKVENKILSSITILKQAAAGYSQSDWDKYTLAYYNDTKKKDVEAIEKMMSDIQYLFTVCEVYAEIVHIEERKYTSGITETEEVEQDDSHSLQLMEGNRAEVEECLQGYIKEGYLLEYKD